MADSTIFGLGQAAVMTAAARFISQKTSGATTPESATFALLGGLEVSAITTDANVTGVVGQLTSWDIDSITAGRDFVLPTSVNVGERVGLYISSGSTTLTEEISIKSGAVGDLINGTDHSSTALTKVFITGELMIFRCVAATDDWIVEYDGRIPCGFRVTLNADVASSETANTHTAIGFDIEDYDVGAVYDAVTNDRVDIRRNGKWHLHMQVKSVAACADQAFYGGRITGSTAGEIGTTIFRASGSTSVMVLVGGSANLVDTETIAPTYVSSQGSRGVDKEQTTGSFLSESFFSGTECLDL